MALLHVSTTGSNTSPYDTWAKAATSWTNATIFAAAGDTIYADKDNSPALAAGSLTVTFPGTFMAPIDVISGVPDTVAGYGVTSVAPGAVVGCDGANLYILGMARFLAMAFRTSNVAGTIGLCTGNYSQRYKNCAFRSALGVELGSAANNQLSEVELESPSIRFDGTVGRVTCYGKIRIRGGGFDTAGSKPSATVFYSTLKATDLQVLGFDMSYSDDLADAYRCTLGGNKVIFRDCVMPAGWIGLPCSITIFGSSVEMWNCTETNYQHFMHHQDSARRIRAVTAAYRTGGASNGVTPIAWEMIALPYTGKSCPARSGPIVGLVTSVGAPVTVSVEIQHGLAAPLHSQNCWLEVEYLGSSANVLGSLATNETQPPAAAGDHPASTADWATPLTYKQKLSVTFTPQRPGYLIARVCGFYASGSSIFIDPTLTIS